MGRVRKPRDTRGKRERPDKDYGARPFVAWDGEGWTSAFANKHHYTLFGASTGFYVQDLDLSTKICLDTMLQVSEDNPKAIHVAFAFGYDANMILRDLPVGKLRRLRATNSVVWEGYRIEHLPGKWFQVSAERDSGRVSCRIQDLFSFFGTSFVKALTGWLVGTGEQISSIAEGKEARDSFRPEDVEEFVKPYWRMELALLVELADALRDVLAGADIHPKGWYGPGTVATCLYKARGTEAHMDRDLPREIIDAATAAYAGGRFEGFRAGLFEGPVYSADINSAYPHAMSLLPSLQNGRWRYVSDMETLRKVPVRLGLFYVRFTATREQNMWAVSGGEPLPKFHRLAHGGVAWPSMSEGWVHAPEARMMVEMYPEQVEFVEGWLYEDDGTYPFAWVSEMYDQRLAWKQAGNPAERALKLGLNSLYGKLAQRIGWDEVNRLPPRWHQLEWAGHITSFARASLHRAAADVAGEGGLIAVETDGVYSTTPFTELPGGSGDALGQWKVEEYTGILFLQSGVYWLRDSNGKWLPPKSRGIPQARLDFGEACRYLERGLSVSAKHTSFIGYGAALHRNRMDLWRTWVESDKSFAFGGDGKRVHNPMVCEACQQQPGFDWQTGPAAGTSYLKGGLHVLGPMPVSDPVSASKALPWLGMADTPMQAEGRRMDMDEVVEA